MQTNHLSHFLLTKELLPLLNKAAELKGEARIVNHTSGARSYPSTPLQAKYYGKNGGNLGGNGNSMLFGGARWERYHQVTFRARLAADCGRLFHISFSCVDGNRNTHLSTDLSGDLCTLFETIRSCAVAIGRCLTLRLCSVSREQSKLANAVFTVALHEKLQAAGSRVKVLVAAPGLAATNLQV